MLTTNTIPYGYSYNRMERTVSIDETEGNNLNTIYAIALESDSLKQILEELRARGITTRHGKSWSVTSLFKLFTKAYLDKYVGQTPGLPAVISSDLYSKILHSPFFKGDIVKRAKRKEYLFSGLGRLKCGTCGSKIYISTTTSVKGDPLIYYRCSGNANQGESFCNFSRLHSQHQTDNLIIESISSDFITDQAAFLKYLQESYSQEIETSVKFNLGKLVGGLDPVNPGQFYRESRILLEDYRALHNRIEEIVSAGNLAALSYRGLVKLLISTVYFYDTRLRIEYTVPNQNGVRFREMVI